jgi:hypothetical protein
MDLITLDVAPQAEVGAEMEIAHPATGVPIGAFIVLAGVDSKIYQDAQHKIANKRMKGAFRRTGIRIQLTSEEMEQETIELVARCTLGWRNIEWKGQPLEYSYENAKMVYTELLWLREQCISFMEDRSFFLKK